MRRRGFIAGLGAAAAWPVVAREQQPMPVVGVLHSVSPEQEAEVITSLSKGLVESGYTEGRNVVLEFRWANNQAARLPELAASLVERRVNVIVALGGAMSTLAAKAATASIPIVFTGGEDPVAVGLVASFDRLGGNVTGINFMSADLA